MLKAFQFPQSEVENKKSQITYPLFYELINIDITLKTKTEGGRPATYLNQRGAD